MKIATTDAEVRQAALSAKYTLKLYDTLEDIIGWEKKALSAPKKKDRHEAKNVVDILFCEVETLVDIINDIGWRQARIEYENDWLGEISYELFIDGKLEQGYNCREERA